MLEREFEKEEIIEAFKEAEGDKAPGPNGFTMAFFHRIANSHRRTNQMRGVEVDGILFKEESDVTDQVVDFYKRLYQEPETWRPTIDGLEFACLDEIC